MTILVSICTITGEADILKACYIFPRKSWSTKFESGHLITFFVFIKHINHC